MIPLSQALSQLGQRSGRRPIEVKVDCDDCQDYHWVSARYCIWPTQRPGATTFIGMRCHCAPPPLPLVDRLMHASGLTKTQRVEFRDLDLGDRRYQEAVREIRVWSEEPEGFLTIMGGTGTGKTVLGWAVTTAINGKGVQCRFVRMPALLEDMRRAITAGAGEQWELFDYVREVPVLVIDDCEVKNMTTWGREQLRDLVRHREAWELPTLVLSGERLDQAHGPMVSRLMGGQVVVLEGPDRRRR